MNRQHSRGFRYRRNSTGWQGSRLRWIAVVAIGVAAGAWSAQAGDQIQKGEMAGYLLVPNEKVPETYNAGFSMYVAAWPLLDQYPGQRFQTGLFGTWMFARKDPPPPIKLYSDIEGGLGWWRDTEYATETPKFIMGGVAPNFSEWANGPGAGKGRDWAQPKGKYGVAQLSPWLLWPPDGLNLKQGTCGELFGYGYLPLPLAAAKSTTAGENVPTGDQCWTLFLNTGNFKGPVAFFTPFFWSRPTVDEPRLAGMFLDKPVIDRNAVQTVSRLNRCHEGKDTVIVVDFTNNARAILKAFVKYRKGTPFEPVEPDPELCPRLYAEILAAGVFSQKDAADLLPLMQTGTDAQAEYFASSMRLRFRARIGGLEERKAFVHLLARYVKSFHFLSCFFTFPRELKEFAAFAEYVGPQLLKKGKISDLMKLIRQTEVI